MEPRCFITVLSMFQSYKKERKNLNYLYNNCILFLH
nr:MAG TPA: hypothetical protein [Caudoviricetes sp.]